MIRFLIPTTSPHQGGEHLLNNGHPPHAGLQSYTPGQSLNFTFSEYFVAVSVAQAIAVLAWVLLHSVCSVRGERNQPPDAGDPAQGVASERRGAERESLLQQEGSTLVDDIHNSYQTGCVLRPQIEHEAAQADAMDDEEDNQPLPLAEQSPRNASWRY